MSSGGGLTQGAANASLSYISVKGAVLLGSTDGISTQASEEACAAACAAAPQASAYNWCPLDAPQTGCEMDTALTIAKPGTCYLLRRQSVLQGSALPIIGLGPDVPTTAGAPLLPDIAAAPLHNNDYSGLPGRGMFGQGSVSRP